MSTPTQDYRNGNRTVRIAALLLAAGRSERFGADNKLLVPIDGIPLVTRVSAALDIPEISDLIAIVAPSSDVSADHLGGPRWRFATTEDRAGLMSDSLRSGLAAVTADIDGVLIALADTPGLDANAVRVLCHHFASRDGTRIVMPLTANGSPAHPIIWPHRYLPALRQLRGDTGARGLLAEASDEIDLVDTNTPDLAFDIDTPKDLAAWQHRANKSA